MRPIAEVNVEGLDEIVHILETIAPKHANNILKTTVNAIAAEIKKDARKNAPSGDTKKLKKAIKSKGKRSKPENPVAIVYVEAGKGAKNDAWYWIFSEYGTVNGMGEQSYIRNAKEKVMGNLEQTFLAIFKKKLAAKIKREQKKKAIK